MSGEVAKNTAFQLSSSHKAERDLRTFKTSLIQINHLLNSRLYDSLYKYQLYWSLAVSNRVFLPRECRPIGDSGEFGSRFVEAMGSKRLGNAEGSLERSINEIEYRYQFSNL